MTNTRSERKAQMLAAMSWSQRVKYRVKKLKRGYKAVNTFLKILGKLL